MDDTVILNNEHVIVVNGRLRLLMMQTNCDYFEDSQNIAYQWQKATSNV